MGTAAVFALSLALAVYGLMQRFQPVPSGAAPQTRVTAHRRFRQFQAALAAVGLAATAFPWLLLGRGPNWAAVLLCPPLLWATPEAWMRLRARRRKALIRAAAVRLVTHLVLQTEAGASFRQAVSSLPPSLRGPLRSEVEELAADLATSPFPAALRRFAARCDLPDIHALARTLIYQQSLGMALPKVLAAEEARFLAEARQDARRRMQGTAAAMAAAAMLLVLNGLLLYLAPVLPVLHDLFHLRWSQ